MDGSPGGKPKLGKTILVTNNDRIFAARISAAANGDEDAIRDLIEEFRPQLIAYAHRRNALDDEGVANTALADAVRNLPTFRGRDRRAFRAYLYRILRRRLADEMRRKATQPRVVATDDETFTEKIVDETASTFDDRLAGADATEHLLSHLTEEQREVVEMRVLTGLSVRETADHTGRSVTAVKAMQRRALVSLRAVLIAAAVIIVGLLGFQLLTSDSPVRVENDPADEGTVDETPDERGTESEADQQSQSVVDVSPTSSQDANSSPEGQNTTGANGLAISGSAAFPGATGWAAETTTGGRGGRVVVVDSLSNAVNADDGIMTFREAMTEIDEPRIIVFSVAGQINYSSEQASQDSQLVLDRSDSDVTVACQSAPEPGVTLVGDGIRFGGEASNVIVRHCRIRNDTPSSAGIAQNSSCLRVMGTGTGRAANDYIFDHVSCMWAAASSIVFGMPSVAQSGGGNIEDVTISNSISAEGDLRTYGTTDNDAGPYATSLGCSTSKEGRRVERCSIVGNLMAHNLKQNARMWGVDQGEMSNNIVYNFSNVGLQAKTRESVGHDLDGSIVGNLIQYGPDSKPSTPELYRPIDLAGNTKQSSFLDVDDNYVGQVGEVPALVTNPLYDNTNSASGPPASQTGNILTMAKSGSSHLRCVGASRPQRDSHDQRMIDEFIQGSGVLGIGSDGARDFSEYPTNPVRHRWADADRDGMPDTWEQKVGVEDPGGNDLSDTYDNLEVFLNGLAQCPSVQVGLNEGTRFDSGTTDVAVPFSTNWIMWSEGQTMEVCLDGQCRDYADLDNDLTFTATGLSAGEHTVRMTPKSPTGSVVGVTDQVTFTIG